MTTFGGGSVAALELRAEPLALRALTDWVTALLGAADAPGLQGAVELAVHEVCMNVIDHAYGPAHTPQPGDITVDATFDDRAVVVRVRDNGVTCERTVGSTAPPGVPTIGGYGLIIVEKLVEELIYQRISNTNMWELRFARTGSPATKPARSPQ